MILVTGGTGLLGSHLLLELTKRHEKVRALHRPSSNLSYVLDTFRLYLDKPEEQYGKIEWLSGDITEYDSLLKALDGVVHVYHAAASISFLPGNRADLMFNNVEGTANVVNACLEGNIAKLCYVSSTAALGNAPPGEEISEDMPWILQKKRTLYSASKFRSELEVWRGIAEGLHAVIVNPSIIIGPGDWKRSSSYLFSAVWNGLRFYTKGVTGYVDVRDVVRAMIDLTESELEGERFTLSSENLSYKEVLTMIAGNLGRKPPRLYASPFLVSLAWRSDWLVHALSGKPRKITREAARSSSRKARFSNQKIRQATGMEFIPMVQSIRDTARIFLQSQGS